MLYLGTRDLGIAIAAEKVVTLGSYNAYHWALFLPMLAVIVSAGVRISREADQLIDPQLWRKLFSFAVSSTSEDPCPKCTTARGYATRFCGTCGYDFEKKEARFDNTPPKD